MSIFLLILKIIGITLLSILGILLLLLFLVLFVPVRYKISANKYEGSDFTANIVISWLLHILNIHVKYLKELFYYVRIFIIPVYKSDNLKKKKRQLDGAAETENSNNDYVKEASVKQENNNTQDTIENKDIEEASNILDTEQNTIVEKNSDENTRITTNEDKEDFETDDISLIDKIFIFTEKVIDFFFNIGDKIETITNKITDIIDDIDYYLDIIEDGKNIEAIKLCLNKLSKVLRHIKPQKVKGNLHIGFEDPYNMGQMLTIYGILYPIIHDKIQLEPEYDTNIVEGDINISGRIQLAVLVWAAFKIYFNKDVRRLLKKFKHD